MDKNHHLEEIFLIDHKFISSNRFDTSSEVRREESRRQPLRKLNFKCRNYSKAIVQSIHEHKKNHYAMCNNHEELLEVHNERRGDGKNRGWRSRHVGEVSKDLL